MTDRKKKLIERMEGLQELIPVTIRAIGDLPDVGTLYTNLDPGKLRVRLDYRPVEYLALRRQLTKKWKYKTHYFNELTGDYFVYFAHRYLNVELSLELTISGKFENGATCRLVEVGHKTTPVYGLECK